MDCNTPEPPPPKCYQRQGGNGYEYICESYGSSRDSDEEYIIDLHPDHFGCSCKHDYYKLREKYTNGVDTSNICKHTALAMQQFYIDHIINRNK